MARASRRQVETLMHAEARRGGHGLHETPGPMERLTVAEVAALLSTPTKPVSVWSVNTYIRVGHVVKGVGYAIRLACYHLPGGAQVSRRQLAEWLSALDAAAELVRMRKAGAVKSQSAESVIRNVLPAVERARAAGIAARFTPEGPVCGGGFAVTPRGEQGKRTDLKGGRVAADCADQRGFKTGFTTEAQRAQRKAGRLGFDAFSGGAGGGSPGIASGTNKVGGRGGRSPGRQMNTAGD